MKTLIAAMLVFVSMAPLASAQVKSRPIPTGPDSVLTAKPNELFNGWKISPAGRHVGVNAMPQKMVLSPDGKTLAMVCAERYDGVALVDVATETTRQWIPLHRAFNGIAFSKDGKQIFVSGGNSDTLYAIDFDGIKAGGQHEFNLADGGTPSADDFLMGLAVDPESGKVFVCNEGANQLIVFDPATQKVTDRWATGARPYACQLGKGGSFIFVSNWGERSVIAINTATGKTVAKIDVGLRPNEMAMAPDGRLFVCCAGDNTVHVMMTVAPKDTDRNNRTDQKAPPPEDALEIIGTSLYDSSPEGSTPIGVAVSPDGKSLFVVNADNNDVMVVDIDDAKESKVAGFVPVGWYPCAVASNGKKLFVANGKGLASAPSYPATRPDTNTVGGTKFDPPLGILSGSVSIIDPPTVPQLEAYTKQVRENSPYTPRTLRASDQPNDSVIPSKTGQECPIKHVLYIIKENRTYDQVYGDMKNGAGKHIGNGDENIVLFGEAITPNQHALAREYVLFDNLYCNSEVSVDGHAWCDAAISNDFNQKNWITSYTKHGHLPGNADTEATQAGFLWDSCRRNNVAYKCYGEGSWAVPTKNRGTWKGTRDPEKVTGWIKDLNAAEASGELPAFMIMSLGENHTKGTQVGANTPQACVASNDQAVGMIVQAFSKSKFWKESAIFIIEDDAQNGPDHVDAHRTAGLVISPFVRRGLVDSTHYTQMSMVRTMELILGLPSLTQYDAAGVPMFSAFMKESVEKPYSLIGPQTDLAAKNSITSFGARASAAMDFDDYDDAPEDPLNRILWASIRGVDVPYPTPIHRAEFAK